MVVDLGSVGGFLLALLPELWLTGAALALLLVVAWRHRDQSDQRMLGQIALLALVSAAFLVMWLWAREAHSAEPGGMMALDNFRYASDLVVILGAIFAVTLSLDYLSREGILVPEYYVLVLLATIGMFFMIGGNDLIVIFLGLELMSVSVYVLAGVNRSCSLSAEAALKYFLLGAFASGFLLYGIALIYGATGSTNLTLIHVRIVQLGLGSNLMLAAGTGLLLIGFGFKIAAVPFHMWAPDVYDGAPTPVTAYMATAVKAAGFAALIRVLLHALGANGDLWVGAIWWLAVVTMVLGNTIALAQKHLKRMLAYSSIGHAGYLLVAIASGSDLGAAAFIFYIAAYTLMTIGSFAILAAAGRDGEREVSIDNLSGLATRRPWLAFAMAVFMMSLLGFPGTAGFMGKWFILSAVIESGHGPLAVIMVIASVVSAGFYLPVVMVMYMKPAVSDRAHENTTVGGPARFVILSATVLLLLFGVWPGRALRLAESGSAGLSVQPTEVLVD